jgi:hypothetical protein
VTIKTLVSRGTTNTAVARLMEQLDACATHSSVEPVDLPGNRPEGLRAAERPKLTSLPEACVSGVGETS